VSVMAEYQPVRSQVRVTLVFTDDVGTILERRGVLLDLPKHSEIGEFAERTGVMVEQTLRQVLEEVPSW
jgi:hypothetical protein